jgi:hypothetical protein
MDLLTKEELKTLLVQPRTPCISLFMPTHRGGSEQDPIRGKNLLRRAEDDLLAGGRRTPEARDLLAPAHRLFEEVSFWKNQSDGLACFLSPEGIRFYRLPLAFTETVVVANHFHIKPFLPLLSGNGRFYVLAISQNQVRLLQGTAHGVQEVDLKGVPANLAQALQFHDRDEPLMFHTHPALGLGRGGAIFHGQGVGIDDRKADLLRYFQQIDRGLHELLRTERDPLVLASVDYLWPIYRLANTYPHLLGQGIAGSPDRLSDKELHAQAWAVVRPHFQQAQRAAAALYDQLAGTGRTAGEFMEVLGAACEGRLEVLFVALGKERWAALGPTGGEVTIHEKAEPGDEDLLNVAAVHTLLHGGTVYAVPPGEVPGGGLLAGIYWVPLAKRGR